MYLHSIEAIADDIFDKLDHASLELLRNTAENDVVMFHLTVGQSIRNEYGLWMPDHPLTKNWHSNPDARDIKNGVDCSEDHPDAVSMRVIKRIYKKANA